MELYDILHGSNAFYKQTNYVEKAKEELRTNQAPAPMHVIETGNKVWRIAQQVFFAVGCLCFCYMALHKLGSFFQFFRDYGLPYVPLAAQLVLFPFTFPHLIHGLVGLATVPGSILSLFVSSSWRKEIDVERLNDQGFKIKRFSIQVDGYTIDAVMMGRNLESDCWMLVSGGNGEFYEVLGHPEMGEYIQDQLTTFLDALETNAIYFNYAGVGASSGLPNRDIMVKAYEAFLKILEEDIKAKTILGYAHSIGGGVQAEALKNHEFKEGVRYLFMKSRTFTDFADTAAEVLFKPIDTLIRFVRWNFETLKSSVELKCPELIFQTTNAHFYQDISKYIGSIIADPIISPSVALARGLLSKSTNWKHKYFMGIRENHNQGIPRATERIAKKVEEMLNAYYGKKA
ncbi:CPn0927/CPn0928 family alpha/beta hydrolase fold protein [Simkania sp.]|uniref:CPn0927/CPn0928 family alpha/beta hydrolase fold protein n=1 Tax=Simkania sp. TaxID=34094 RepID=UPI003B519D99